MKNNKGITLVALIITIIVMLILVAVSINVVIKSNILNSAKTAGEITADAVEKEANLGEVTIDGIVYDSMEDYINNKPSTGLKLTLEHTDTAVTADGTKVASVVDGVPIPVGFTASSADGENTKAGGLVIYEGNTAVTNSNVETARTTRNQFVWVPVLQNQIIKVESKEDITSIEVKDALNRTIETENITKIDNKTYKVAPTINGVYTVTAAIGEDEVTETLEVHSLYAQDFWMDWKEGQDITTLLNYSDSTIATYKNSVNKYGGFYIARYEAGKVDNNAVSKKNQIPYNNISQTNAISKANIYSSSTHVTSCLINAAAWDRTQNWLVETNAITKADMIGDSSSWGNYYKTSISGLTTKNRGTLLDTGITEYTNRKNIYDLAGNLWERTTEAYSYGNVVSRGGDYFVGGTPSSYRFDNRPSSYSDLEGFRPTLYINL